MTATDFSGKTAFVTGAARGFGLAFCQALSERGAAVWIADVDGDEAEAAAGRLRAQGRAAQAAVCDVTDEAAVKAALARAAEATGGIDILINNAGLHSQAYNDAMLQAGVAKLRKLFDVNLMGVVICSLAAHPHMRGRPGAAIVNIASVASYQLPTAYGVSKLAVRGLTVTLAREFGADGIRVNAIAPGLIFTDTIRAELAPEHVAAVLGGQIIKREGEVEDIVQAMLHLCSPAAGFVTGETLRVSGGFGLSL